jgi:predicted ester cyclase
MNSHDKLEQNKTIYRRFLQKVFNEGQLNNLGEFLSKSYVVHDAPPGTPTGWEAIKHIVTMFRTAFPDLHITIDELVAEGDKVCARATTRGTHQGPIFGIPPTGKPVEMTGLTMVTISNGCLIESWVKNDVMGLMKQLGGESQNR